MDKYKNLVIRKITIQQPSNESEPRVSSLDLYYSNKEESLMDHIVAIKADYSDLYSMYLDYKNVSDLKDLFIRLNKEYNSGGVFKLKNFIKDNFNYEVEINYNL